MRRQVAVFEPATQKGEQQPCPCSRSCVHASHPDRRFADAQPEHGLAQSLGIFLQPLTMMWRSRYPISRLPSRYKTSPGIPATARRRVDGTVRLSHHHDGRRAAVHCRAVADGERARAAQRHARCGRADRRVAGLYRSRIAMSVAARCGACMVRSTVLGMVRRRDRSARCCRRRSGRC